MTVIIQIWSDLLCPFAYVALNGLTKAREELGLSDSVHIDHHSFPLELFNGPHPRRGTDTEAVGIGQIAPELELRVWAAADDLYPHTVLLAAEAVQAAKEQGLPASEKLDRGLRKAFWTDSRSISHRQVILDVAGECGLEVDKLSQALDTGRHRQDVMADFEVARTDAIQGSPTIVFPDGSTVHNPGITVHWEGPWAAGYPVVDSYDSSVYRELLKQAIR